MIKLLSICTMLVNITPPTYKPVSPEELQALVKKLEEPRRSTRDGQTGPPDYAPPEREFSWNGDVLDAIESAGPQAIPLLIALYEDKSKPVQARCQAIMALTSLIVGFQSHPDPKAIETVRKAIRDPNPLIRENSLHALHFRGRRCSQSDTRRGWVFRPRIALCPLALQAILPDVIAACGDKSPEVVANAAAALYWLSQPGVGVTELLSLLQHADGQVWANAAWSLGEVGRDDPRVLPALIARLKKRDLPALFRVAAAVGGYGPLAKDAVSELIDCLKDKEVMDKAEVFGPHPGPVIVWTLGEIGPAAKAAVPALREYHCPYGGVMDAIKLIDPATFREIRDQQEKAFEELKRRQLEGMPKLPLLPGMGPPRTEGMTDRRRGQRPYIRVLLASG